MADTLLEAMDRLWFHQIVLFTEPISYPGLTNQSVCTSSCLSVSLLSEEENASSSPYPNGEISSHSSATTQQDDEEKETRLNHITRESDSYFSSQVMEDHDKHLRNSGTMRRRRLHKTMSCMSLGELELEEVKGFMDLGFVFNKEQLNPKMLSLVPGLQRIRVYKKQQFKLFNVAEVAKGNETEEEEEEEEEEADVPETKKVQIRPYLSEAWLIKRSNSPLLNLRIPRASTGVDMKKHLKFWARAVASVIHQES